jgi:hypothetical protein
MRKANNIYCATGIISALAGATGVLTAELRYNAEQFLVSSIIWDYNIEIDSTTFIPVEQQVNQQVQLTFSYNPDVPISRPFINASVPGSMTTPAPPRIFRPGQYNFDSLFLTNESEIQIVIENNDLVNDVNLRYSLTFEISPV